MPETIIIGSDHAGFDLKERVKEWLEERGFAVEDVGSQSPEQVDYPHYAHLVADAIGSGRRARGIVICGTGIGVSIAANRHAGVRAAVVCGEETARFAREHNDANVLALGGVAAALALVALVALATPAWSAASIEPARAMRVE